jgi:hypothetical protein
MALPSKLKKHLPLIPEKVGRERRQEMLDDITDHGTFLPKGVLHADLDLGMLDFVKEDLKLVTSEKTVPTVDKIITTQNWSQFTETWDFQDLDKNISLPFIATVRNADVKYGTFQGGAANIPNRRQFFYYTVPTWDGQRKGADVYTIPQPIPVDITYNVKLFCNRMREVNDFNKIVMQKFTSKQAYRQIKGHYIPIIMEGVGDESVKEIAKRKYYIVNYTFIMKGLLIDESEFKVSPAITRQVSLFETETRTRSRKVNTQPPRPDNFDLDLLFVVGNNQLSEVFRYSVDLKVTEQQNLINCYNATYSAITNTNLTYINCSGNVVTSGLTTGNTSTICVKGGTIPSFSNVTGATYTTSTSCASGYSVYINGNYVGDDLDIIQINDGDTLLISVYKNDITKDAVIKTVAYLV